MAGAAACGEPRRGARRPRAPLAGGRGRGPGRRLPAARRRQGSRQLRARRGDRRLPRAPPLAERRGDDREMALVLFKPRSPSAPRCASPSRTRRTAGPSSTGRRRSLLGCRRPASRRRPPRCRSSSTRRGDRVDRHPALHAGVRPPRRGMARAHVIVPSWPSAGRFSDDGPALRLPPSRRRDLVGRHAADRGRRRVTGSSDFSTRRPRARSVAIDFVPRVPRTTTSSGTPDAPGPGRSACPRRADGRVPAGCAGSVLPQRPEPAGRGPAAPPRDRARRRRLGATENRS